MEALEYMKNTLQTYMAYPTIFTKTKTKEEKCRLMLVDQKISSLMSYKYQKKKRHADITMGQLTIG